MPVFGGVFRKHCANGASWEVEKNLVRLASDWTEATGMAIATLREQAAAFVHGELATLRALLSHPPEKAAALRGALDLLRSVPATGPSSTRDERKPHPE
jgi:hypothetical protein